LGGFGDIFDSFFGGSGFGSRSSSNRNRPTRGSDLKYSMDLDFEEAIFGTEKEFDINRIESCSKCRGSKAEPGSWRLNFIRIEIKTKTPRKSSRKLMRPIRFFQIRKKEHDMINLGMQA
jgi:DnaJ-class molecular chaperone